MEFGPAPGHDRLPLVSFGFISKLKCQPFKFDYIGDGLVIGHPVIGKICLTLLYIGSMVNGPTSLAVVVMVGIFLYPKRARIN